MQESFDKKKGCKKLSDQRFGGSDQGVFLSFCRLNGIGSTCTMNE